MSSVIETGDRAGKETKYSNSPLFVPFSPKPKPAHVQCLFPLSGESSELPGPLMIKEEPKDGIVSDVSDPQSYAAVAKTVESSELSRKAFEQERHTSRQQIANPIDKETANLLPQDLMMVQTVAPDCSPEKGCEQINKKTAAVSKGLPEKFADTVSKNTISEDLTSDKVVANELNEQAPKPTKKKTIVTEKTVEVSNNAPSENVVENEGQK